MSGGDGGGAVKLSQAVQEILCTLYKTYFKASADKIKDAATTYQDTSLGMASCLCGGANPLNHNTKIPPRPPCTV